MTTTRPIVQLECEFRYEAAHRLPLVPPGHQCGRMHGHSYHLTVTVAGAVADEGFVADFADIKDTVAPIIKQLDHHCLNDIPGLENPTVELQLVWMWQRLVNTLPAQLVELRLRETANNSATYRGTSQ